MAETQKEKKGFEVEGQEVAMALQSVVGGNVDYQAETNGKYKVQPDFKSAALGWLIPVGVGYVGGVVGGVVKDIIANKPQKEEATEEQTA